MMFTTNKIKRYLEQKIDESKPVFDSLLMDYLDGTLKEFLMSIGIKKSQIHVDWNDSMKCIGIQGRYKKYYIESQIYPYEFTVSFDLIEPDEDISYPLESKDQLYNVISDIIKTL